MGFVKVTLRFVAKELFMQTIVYLHKIVYNICMKIGIFGGTFNPPHNSHLQIALQAKQQLGLDKLLVFPCGDPPHKTTDVSAAHRLEMTRLAFGSFAEVCDYEILQQGKSYTYHTLLMLKERFPADQLYLIIGGDSYQNFGKWYNPQGICQLAHIVVAQRLGTPMLDEQQFEKQFNAQVTYVQVEPTNTSSSLIRLQYQFGKSNADVVPSAVDQYVKENNLYSQYRTMVDKLQPMLNEKRFNHTFWVVERGLQIAPAELKHKAFVACLLHDCAKHIDLSAHASYGFVQGDMPQSVVHAFLGALVAEKYFGVTDTDVLDAIRYHCTARPNMTLLEKIVYVADKTERTRSYPIDHLLIGDVHNMFCLCLQEAYDVCKQRHASSIHPLTEQAVEFYNLHK